MFANNGKNIQQMGEAQKFPHALADIEQLQLATYSFCRSVESDERPKARAVHRNDVRQVQHHSFGVRDDWTDVGVQNTGQPGDYVPVASHNRRESRQRVCAGETFGWSDEKTRWRIKRSFPAYHFLIKAPEGKRI